MGRFFCALTAFALIAAAPRFVGAAQSAQLVYVRAAGAERCGDEDVVRREVAARMGYDPFVASARLTVIVQLEAARGRPGFGGRVQVVDASGLVRGERQLSSASADCIEVIRAAALAISLTLDLLPPTPEPAPDPAPEAASEGASRSPPEPVASDAPPDDLPPPPLRIPESGSRWAAGIFGIVGMRAGFADRALGHAGIGASFGRDSWFVEADGTVTFAEPEASLSPRGAARTSLLLGSVAPCARVRFAFGCAALVFGRYAVESEGVASPAAADAVYVGAALRGGVEIKLGSVAFARAALEVGVPFRRHTVSFNRVSAYELSAVSFSTAVGVGARF